MAPATVAGSPHTDFGHAPAIPKGQFTTSVRTDREAGSVTCPARLKSPIIPARRTVRAARRPSIALGSMSPIGGSKPLQALTEQVSVHHHPSNVAPGRYNRFSHKHRWAQRGCRTSIKLSSESARAIQVPHSHLVDSAGEWPVGWGRSAHAQTRRDNDTPRHRTHKEAVMAIRESQRLDGALRTPARPNPHPGRSSPPARPSSWPPSAWSSALSSCGRSPTRPSDSATPPPRPGPGSTAAPRPRAS